jgi:hypothetical protein
VRLGGYILLELVVGTSLAAGGGAAAFFGVRELLATPMAQAYAEQIRQGLAEEPPHDDFRPSQADMLPIDGPGAPAALAARSGTFLGVHDDVLLEPLRTRDVVRAKFNRGGSSISMRVDFEGGGRASFKVDQTNLQSVPRKEVAAYRVNRLLGLSSVAPCVAREIPRAQIENALDDEGHWFLPRFDAEVTPMHGPDLVSGSLAWWIPEIVDARIDGYTVDSTDGIVTWKRYLTIGEPIPYESRFILPQISDMVAFDFLINNVDRWSGSNVKGSPDGRWLYFMDNALAFGLQDDGTFHTQAFLERSQKFSRSLYVALSYMDEAAVRDAMTTDTGPYDALLTDEEIASMLHRRDYILSYIDGLIAQYGREQVLVFP